MKDSDWGSIWEVLPPDVKTLFEKKIGSRPARMMAARARLVCSSWAANLQFPVMNVSNNVPSEGTRSRVLKGAKTLSWIQPPTSLLGISCAKTLLSLNLNYIIYNPNPESTPSSVMLNDLICHDEYRPHLMESLSVNWCNLKAEELQNIKILQSLKSLELQFANINDDALIYISYIQNLTSLDISSNPRVTDSGISYLPKSLNNLKVAGCDLITDKGIEMLPKNITSLDISYCKRITDTGIYHLNHVTNLKLKYCTNVHGSGLVALKNVRSLDVSRVGWDMQSYLGFCFTCMEKLSNLTVLNASGIHIRTELSIPTLTSLDHACGSGPDKMSLPALT